VPSLDRLPQVNRTALLTRPVEVHHETPFTPLTVAPSELRLAIVTTAGLHLKGDRPFTADDGTFRVIPSSAGEAELVQSHTSIGFERASQARDIDVVFPRCRPLPRGRRRRGGGRRPSRATRGRRDLDVSAPVRGRPEGDVPRGQAGDRAAGRAAGGHCPLVLGRDGIGGAPAPPARPPRRERRSGAQAPRVRDRTVTETTVQRTDGVLGGTGLER